MRARACARDVDASVWGSKYARTRLGATERPFALVRFTTQHTTLTQPPKALEHFDDPDDPADRTHWERFLRRTLNFTYGFAAVSAIAIAGRGDGYYNWRVELVRGNPPAWVSPFLNGLVARIQAARESAGKPPIDSLVIAAPGESDVRYTRRTA